MSTAMQLKLGVTIVLCCLVADASAQQRLIRRGDRAGNRGSESGVITQTSGTAPEGQTGQTVNNQFAACLLQANQGEVKLSKLAAERAESNDVKSFAEQMIKDHSAIVEKLDRLVGNQQPNDRRSQIEKQINERCLEMVQEELDSKSGKEFDACYVGTQIAGHMHMLAALEVLADQTTGQLQQIVEDAQPKVEKHYQQAQRLMKQVDERHASNN